MKRFHVCIMALVLLLMANQIWAQTRKSQVELFGGAAFPLAPTDFKDFYKIGGSLHGQYVIFPSPTVGVSFGAAVEGFTVDQDAILNYFGLQGSGVTVDGSASVVELGVGVRPYLTKPEANTQFFVFGMGTFNFLHEEFKATFAGQSNTVKSDANKAGLAAGAGFELPAGEKLNIIVQGLARFIFNKKETDAYGNETGGTISFIGVTAGVVF
jgi:hypothetical protein